MTFKENPYRNPETQDLIFEFVGEDKPHSRGPKSHLFRVAGNAITHVDEWQGNYAGGTIWEVGKNEDELNRALANAKQWNEQLYLQMMKLINR